MQNTDIITIMERTLNYIDNRLNNHGRRVAYIVYQMLWPTGRYNIKEIRDICLLALLHDIGAYKTEEIDKMVDFETEDTLDHSIYGYLFLKYFSPLASLSDAILQHHSDCARLDRTAPNWELAQIIFIADRMDILTLGGFDTKEKLYGKLRESGGELFCVDILDRVLTDGLILPVSDADVTGDCVINRVLYEYPLTDEEIIAYLQMIVLFIDFRSHQTFTHTIATTSICDYLAKILGVGRTARTKLLAGSWLHDIGKTGIPLSVLEKPDRLTADEMALVQRHVCLTDEILKDTVLDEVRRIAVHHHEKLDGSGYPDGLGAKNLAICERIAVVADIFSALCGVRSYKNAFPKEQVVVIIKEMAGNGLLDSAVVETCIQYYDAIIEHMEESIRPYEQTFQVIEKEFQQLKSKMNL